MTFESLSHVMPENEQCVEREDGDELLLCGAFQSSRPEPEGPIMEDLNFKSGSRSE